MLDLILGRATKIKDGIYSPIIPLHFKERGLKGCNWGIQKKSLFQINGFDEAYVHATVGEDDDVEWRLKGMGFKKYAMKNKAIVYHLHHKRTYHEEGTEINLTLMQERVKKQLYYCKDGITNTTETNL